MSGGVFSLGAASCGCTVSLQIPAAARNAQQAPVPSSRSLLPPGQCWAVGLAAVPGLHQGRETQLPRAVRAVLRLAEHATHHHGQRAVLGPAHGRVLQPALPGHQRDGYGEGRRAAQHSEHAMGCPADQCIRTLLLPSGGVQVQVQLTMLLPSCFRVPDLLTASVTHQTWVLCSQEGVHKTWRLRASLSTSSAAGL